MSRSYVIEFRCLLLEFILLRVVKKKKKNWYYSFVYKFDYFKEKVFI